MTMVILMMIIIIIVIVIALMIMMIKIILIIAVVTIINNPFEPGDFSTESTTDHGHNILIIFYVFPIFPFNTSEAKPDY